MEAELSPGPEPPASAYDRAALLQYLALQDQVRWQGPALALAAQAFLLTVALAESTTVVARITGAILGAATSWAGIHLISRKTHQVALMEPLIHSAQLPISSFAKDGVQASRVWQLTLSLFFAADLFITALALTHSNLLGVTR